MPPPCGYNVRSGPVRKSDQLYADTVGKDDRPELIVARIPGNSAAKLRKALDTSLALEESRAGYSFDRSHALCISGGESGMNDWIWDINMVAGILDDQFSVDKLSCPEYFEAASLVAPLRQGMPWRSAT